MYRKRFSITGLIAGILSLILIALGVLACIPETRSKMADFVANKFSPAYAEIKDENSKQAEEIKSLNGQIKGLNDDITAKNLAIDEKNKLIAEKDSKIASQQEQLATCIVNINTLTTQRTTLLASVTEIDNKINSTTDSVELENLEARKTAILAQIDTLNTQITTLTQEKTQLEADIATLRQEKAQLESEIAQLKEDKRNLQAQVEVLEKTTNFTYIGTANFIQLRENSSIFVYEYTQTSLTYDDIWSQSCCVIYGNAIYFPFSCYTGKYVKDNFPSEITEFWFDTYDCYEFLFNGQLRSVQTDDVYSEHFNLNIINYYLNDEPLSSLDDLVDGMTYYVNFYGFDSNARILNVNFIPCISGIYFSDSNNCINFDTMTMTINGVSENINYVSFNKNWIYINDYSGFDAISQSSFKFQDEIYTKQTSAPTEEPTEPTVTADNLILNAVCVEDPNISIKLLSSEPKTWEYSDE